MSDERALTLSREGEQAMAMQEAHRRRYAEQDADAYRAKAVAVLTEAGYVATGRPAPPADPFAAVGYWRSLAANAAALIVETKQIDSRREWLTQRVAEGRLTCTACGHDLDPGKDEQLAAQERQLRHISDVLANHGWRKERQKR